jgi:ketosteroid isomerase-like protein
MHRIFFHTVAALITFLVGISIAGAWKPPSRKPVPRPVPPRVELEEVYASNAPDPVTKQEICELYRQYALAQTRHDVSFFENVEADSFVLTYISGSTLTRDEAIASMKTWDKNIKYSNEVLNIRVYGDVVIIKGQMMATYTDSGYGHQWQWLDVIMKRDGHWQILSTTQLNN